MGFLQPQGLGTTLGCSGWASHCGAFSWAQASRRASFSTYSTRTQELWHPGLVALRHVKSSRTKDTTHVPCIGRQVPTHGATREVPVSSFLRTGSGSGGKRSLIDISH